METNRRAQAALSSSVKSVSSAVNSSASSSIRLGVIGAGSMGKNHARIFGEMPDAQFTAVFDERKEIAGEIAAKYGARAVGIAR